MSRYIDAEKLKDDIAVLFERNEKLIDEWLANCVDDVIDEQPTADVQEVVRCKDCKHSRSDEFEPLWCYVSETCDPVKADHFCGYGERRDE